MSFDKWITIIGALTVILTGMATPIIVKIIEGRALALALPNPAAAPFGITIDPDAERADRMTDIAMGLLKARAEEAEAEARAMRLRLDAANAALSHLSQPTH